jgi:hypothetical protein
MLKVHLLMTLIGPVKEKRDVNSLLIKQWLDTRKMGMICAVVNIRDYILTTVATLRTVCSIIRELEF